MKLFSKMKVFQFSPFFVKVSNRMSKLSIFGTNFLAIVTMTLLVPLFLVWLMFIIEKSLGLKANIIEGLNDLYVKLRELSLVVVGLTTLKGFPSFSDLGKLDLNDNKLSFGLYKLTRCPQLAQLLLKHLESDKLLVYTVLETRIMYYATTAPLVIKKGIKPLRTVIGSANRVVTAHYRIASPTPSIGR